jgi:hypothetical protein
MQVTVVLLALCGKRTLEIRGAALQTTHTLLILRSGMLHPFMPARFVSITRSEHQSRSNVELALLTAISLQVTVVCSTVWVGCGWR